MTLDQLRYFKVIAELEHYGRASELLHVTQPNLSHAISQLEAELGIPLFEKSGRNIRITRYGRQFLESVSATLEDLDGSIRSLKDLQSGGGLIMLGATRNLGTQLVPSLMRDFVDSEQGRNVSFRLHTKSSFSSVLLEQTAHGNYDMAFTTSRGDSTVFETIEFPQSPFVVVVSLNHPLAELDKVDLYQTLGYLHIFLSRDSALRSSVDELFWQIGSYPKISYETEEDFVAAGLAEAGFGIAILPDHPFLHTMKLKILSLSNPDPKRTAYLSMTKQGWHSQASVNFYEFCKDKLLRS